MKKRLPLILTLLFAGWIAGSLRVPKDKDGALAVQEFGQLPVVSGGRVQPIDSLARNSLLQLRGITGVPLEGNGPDGAWGTWESFGPDASELHERKWYQFSKHPKKLKPAAWLAEVVFDPKAADERYVFVINHPTLRSELNLKDGVEKSGLHFYRFKDLRGSTALLRREAMRASAIDSSKRTPFDQAVMRLWSNTSLYMRLQNSVQPYFEDFATFLKDSPLPGTKYLVETLAETKAANAVNWPEELQQFLANVGPGVEAVRANQSGKSGNAEAIQTLKRDLARFEVMTMEDQALLIPPHHPEQTRDEWMKSGAALMEVVRGEQLHFALLSYAKMAGAYRGGNVAEFNSAVREYRGLLDGRFAPELKKAASERRFNQFEPFYKSMVVYIAALLCALIFWVRPKEWETSRRCAVWLVGLALVVHTSGLIYRMVLEGRPPVTNLYSSAIFIGWGACILGLVLERFWRNGIGVVVSSLIGFITLIIAHHLSLTGDTMEMMRAVLDTNIWLATHVVIITLGYASTFVAGFLGMLYVILGVFTRILSMRSGKRELATLAAGVAVGGVVGGAIAGSLIKSSSAQSYEDSIGKSLVKMIYGIVCFATLFSFVGTVLGGIWADQSWGRFWGWDPKENGALIIVLWNALILHARWGGMVRERGLVNMAIVGNIVTSWSWFGVNMLGIGLHSYGFMDAAFYWLMSFVVFNLALIALGSLPLSLWRSFRSVAKPVSEPILA